MGVARKLTALDRFYENLAHKPWCGDDKAAQLVRPKAAASQKLYIAPNPPAMVHWLIFDLDHDNCLIWEDKNLPVPNIIVQNPSNGKSHLYYALSPVCVSDNARKAPIYYMEAVARGLSRALEADEQYTGRIAKNPLSPHWRTTEIHWDEFTLGELADYVDPVSKWDDSEPGQDSGGRNVTLFNSLRHWAYGNLSNYKGFTSESRWRDAVLSRALSLATVERDFTYNEIKNTAKSVAKWVWNNYTANHRNKGVMNLEALDISLQAKQRLAARRTHKLRSNATERRIEAAIEELTLDNKPPSKSAVAQHVGLSRQQISRRYSHLFNPSRQPDKEAVNGVKKRNFWCSSGSSQGKEFPSDKRGHNKRDNKECAFGATLLPPNGGLDRAARKGKAVLASVTYLPERLDEGD